MRYRLEKNEILFWTAYGLYILVFLVNCTVIREIATVQLALKGIRYVCYLLAIVKIVKSSFIDKQILQSCILFILIGLAAIVSEDRSLIFHILIFWAARNVNSRSIIKLTVIFQCVVVFGFTVLSQLGIVVDTVVDKTTRQRHLLGLEWANTAPTLFFFIVMSYIYLRKKNIKLLELAVIEVINIWFFIMTNTKMSFALLTVALIYVFIMKFYWQNHRDRIYKNKWLLLLPTAACCFSIALHWFYREGNSTWDRLNTILTGRLALGFDAIKTYGISWFGTHIEWIGFGIGTPPGKVYNYVDCSYLQILLSYGIVFLAIIIIAYTYVMYKAIVMKDFYLQTALLFILVFSITEPRLFNFAYNPFPILAISFWGTNKISAEDSNTSHKIKNWILQMPQVQLKMRH